MSPFTSLRVVVRNEHAARVSDLFGWDATKLIALLRVQDAGMSAMTHGLEQALVFISLSRGVDDTDGPELLYCRFCQIVQSP